MINPRAREKIVSLVTEQLDQLSHQNNQSAPSTMECWEIGPGLGALTALLLDKPWQVRAFEIDHGFVRILSNLFGDNPRFSLVPGDALKTWNHEFVDHGVPRALVGNLPYSTGSVMIGTFLEEQFLPPTMVFTLQKEVGLRLAAKPGTKMYSGFSVLAQIYYHVELAGELGPGSFYPQPEVDSIVIRMVKRSDLPQLLPKGTLVAQLIRAAFSSRRKTLLNNYKSLGTGVPSFESTRVAAEALGIDLGLRGEVLQPQEFFQLAQALSNPQ
jgi:16S rRNA (adenine1518-N6/adenine1519-N6)-dimethyltransferase